MSRWWSQKWKDARSSGSQLSQLLRHSPRLGKQVLKNIPEWDAVFGKSFRLWLVSLFVEFQHRERCIQHISASIPTHFETCSNYQKTRMQQSFLKLCKMNNSALFDSDDWVNSVWSVLPNLLQQFDDAWIEDWIQKSLTLGQSDLSAGLAQLKLETERSVQEWKNSSHRVYLSDVQSRLWPYMDSHLGEWQGLVNIHMSDGGVYTDSIDLFLPAWVECPSDDVGFGWMQYRIWVARLTAFFEFGSFDFDMVHGSQTMPTTREGELEMELFFRSFADQSLAKRLFFGLEEFRIFSHVKVVYPGISARMYTQLKQDAKDFCAQPTQSVLQRALADVFRVLYQLTSTVSLHSSIEPFVHQIMELQNLDRSVEDTVLLTQHLFKSLYALNRSAALKETSVFSTSTTSSKRRRTRWLAQNKRLNFTKSVRKKTLADAQHTVNDMEEQLAFLDSNPSSVGGLLSERVEEPQELRADFVVEGAEIVEGRNRYPEWDVQLSDIRPNWTLVREIRMQPNPNGLEFWERVQLENGQEMRKIRSIFQMLKDNMTTRKRGLLDGDRLEFDRWMDARIQRKMGQTPDMNLYSKSVFQNRDPAVAFLVDLSSSTNEITTGAVPILDIEKSALMLMSEALSSIGDPFAIFGYSGFGREQVAFYIAKDVDEPWNESTRSKVGALKWKMENRDGAAIRHATAKMRQWTHQQRILFILSDGKPLDCGDKYYYDSYAQADTRQALNETREAGITPFCITVDPYGQEYLPELYGPHGFVAIENMANFSQNLAKVYAAMTLR